MMAILEETYFEWLYSNIEDPRLNGNHKTYWKLARQLHQKEFIYTVANDDNRWEDGRRLRIEFLDQWWEEDAPSNWVQLGCSMLEMLVALSRRLEFQTDEPAQDWFWILLKNIGISNFNDDRYNETAARKVDETLDRVIWRRYSDSGKGGLFPLRRADRDQRDLEIWFQMHTYLIESLF